MFAAQSLALLSDICDLTVQAVYQFTVAIDLARLVSYIYYCLCTYFDGMYDVYMYGS